MNTLLSRKCNTEYFNTINATSHDELTQCISKYMSKTNITKYTPVVLCIGTDRATGDCLGPLVGKKLIDSNCKYTVVGNLEKPVHALNIHQAISMIYKKISNPYIIAIDASLGSSSHVGCITVSDCPIFPGKGVNKKLPAIGNISITGIVNVSGKNPTLLQSTRLNIVMDLADCIANALINAIEDY